jgi:hypothetical protein
MKKTILIIFFILSSISYAQTFDWAIKQGAYNCNIIGSGIDNKSNIYETGSFWDTAYFESQMLTIDGPSLTDDAFIAKHDSLGNLIWVKQLGHAGSYTMAMSVDKTGEFLIGAKIYGDSILSSSTNAIISSANGHDLIAKFDANGNIIWFLQGEVYGQGAIYSVDILPTGGGYVTGVFTDSVRFGTNIFVSPPGLDGGHNGNGFILKLDSLGNILWMKIATTSYTPPQTSNGVWMYSVTHDNFGCSYIFGMLKDTVTFDNISVSSVGVDESAFVIKYNASGIPQWIYLMDFYMGDARKIVCDGINSLYIGGDFYQKMIFGTDTLTCQHVNGFIAKFDLNGNFNWAKQTSDSLVSTITDIALDNNNSLFACGNYIGVIHFNQNVSLTNTSLHQSAFVCQYDLNGVPQWAITTLSGTQGELSGIKIAANNNSSYLSGMWVGEVNIGAFHFIYSDYPSRNLFLTKIGSGISTSQSEIPIQNSQLQIFPNPTTSTITLQSPYSISQLKIYNPYGEIILHQTLNSKHQTLNLSTQPKGIYFLEIIADNKREMRKIVVN